MVKLEKTAGSIIRGKQIARQNAALRANDLGALREEFAGQYRRGIMKAVREGCIKGGILGL